MAVVDSFSLIFESLSRYCGSWRDLFAGVGLVVVGRLTVKALWAICSSINVHYIGARNVRYRLTQYGQWAVITGCTRGVGREFAKLLASFGLDVILIARDEARLKSLAESLENDYGVQTLQVVADFSQGAVIYDSIKDAVADKEIGILINNVGVMYEYPEYFVNISEKRLWELVNVNMGAAQAMTHLVLRSSMMSRRSGLIVYMSSLAGYQPSPLMSAYAATKAYETYLASCLYYECQQYNVHVQTLTPSFIATDMTAYHDIVGQANILSPTPEKYVREAS